ncbi:cytochrome P450 [Myxococcota bacterium]|nr:cytochrome P450 [Myxococcota bacterium]
MTTASPRFASQERDDDRDFARDAALAREMDRPDQVLGAILDPSRRGSLYPFLHRLRALAPAYRTEALSGKPTWVLTRYNDVRENLRNPDVRSDARGVDVFDVGPSGRHFVEMQRNTLLFLPPDKHDQVRALISKAFTPRSVEQRDGRIREVIHELLDRVEPKGRMDLVPDFAFLLPVIVICEMLGVPTEDLPRFYDWAHQSTARGEIGKVTEQTIREGEEATLGYAAYFRELIEDHRRRPRRDLMSALIDARDEEGRGLSDEELVGSCYILLQAGHGTTQDLLGMGMLALLRHPDQHEFLRRNPSALPTAVEEFLRYDTSVQISQRVADIPIELSGVRIPAGEVCVIFNGAVNRDPEVFHEPDRLDVRRSPNPHLSFGLGRHTCLGQSQARKELLEAFDILLERFPNMRLDDAKPPVYRDSLFLRGLATLPVVF